MARDEIQPISRTTQIKGDVPFQDFQRVLSDIGTSSNVLGQMGADIAQKSSNLFSENAGYESGKNPHGDLLPSLTKSDEHFALAYKTQSQATLGNLLSSMTSDSQLELAKAGKLTPELIQSYQDNMQKGADEILESAPGEVKNTLENNFASSLIRTTGELKQKLFTQQKSDTYKSQASWNNSESKEIYEASKASASIGGDLNEALSRLENVKSSNKTQVETGIFTKEQEPILNQQSKLSMLYGKYDGLALKAESDGNLDEFMFNLGSKKPVDLNFKEWDQVLSSVSSFVSRRESAKSRNQASLIAKFNEADSRFSVTPSMMAELKDKLNDSQYNHLMFQHNIKLNKLNSNLDKIKTGVSVWTDSKGFNQLSNNIKDKSFNTIVDQSSKDRPELPLSEIEQAVIMSAAGPVPKYTSKISSDLASGNADKMMSASLAVENIHRYHANNLPLSQDSQNALSNFNSRASQHGDIIKAAEEAHQLVYSPTIEQKDAGHSAVVKFKKEHLRSSNQSIRFAMDILGVSPSEMLNPEAITNAVVNGFNSNLILQGGDVEAAKDATKKSFKRTYGVSNVNGNNQLMYMPIEKVLNIGKDSASTINSDLASQLNEQFKELKSLFDEKDSKVSQYYRITKMPNIDEALKASLRYNSPINKDASSEAEFFSSIKNDSKILHDFTKNPIIEVEQVNRNNDVHKFNIAIQASPLMTISNVGQNQFLGNYDVKLVSENGRAMPLTGASSSTVNGIHFRPNATKILEHYYALNPSPSSQKESIFDRVEKFKKGEEGSSNLKSKAIASIGQLIGGDINE